MCALYKAKNGWNSLIFRQCDPYICRELSCISRCILTNLEVYSNDFARLNDPMIKKKQKTSRLSWRDWLDVAEFESMEKGVEFVTSGSMMHEQEKLRFKTDRSKHGPRGFTKFFVCSSHVKCPMQVRVNHRVGKYYVQKLTTVEHASKVDEHLCKGGVFKAQDTAMVTMLVDSGAKPAEIMASLTKKAVNAATAVGQLKKRPSGGLKCAPRRTANMAFQNMPGYSQNISKIYPKYTSCSCIIYPII